MTQTDVPGVDVQVHDTVIVSDGVPLAARIHRRADAGAGPQPGVVVAGSWLTVKEQMPDLYAARFAEQGWTAVTFDFAGFGASRAEPAQTELPYRKMGDLAAVVRALRGSSWIDADRLGVVGVCAGAQFVLGAVAAGLPVRAFAAVAGWFHDLETVAPFYGGAEGVAQRLATARHAARTYSETGRLLTVPAYAAGDPDAAMSLEMDYYANPERGAVPEWRNEMSVLTWHPWLTFNAFAHLPAVTTPTLLVHSDDAVLPDNVRRVAAGLGRHATTMWAEGAQTDFYDQPDQVDAAVAAVVDHFTAAGRSS
ncbi:dienelactone hydrolase family protein [Actinoplanes sp. NPDC023801]|uniref:alpha/beta hydrolase n=1 Tax=Actinoplanes sp. NPDC023801 TaxID=3154595 RepID=UPI003403048E